ncbi:MAG: hypothetical protein KKG47_04355 [Proteobacteria bacterium]|nr:hypothetical protein [Pseudomonadota bacterium]MBU1738174.1 hypothetical protein [Pseudomonadota bacterium]
MKQLGLVKNIVEEAGMGVSYAYEDLVFLEHNSFLLQFTDHERELFVCINREADRETVDPDISRLQAVATGQGLRFMIGDPYTLTQGDDESVIIEFCAP